MFTYVCAKPQESLHWSTLIHTDTCPTVPLNKSVVYILEAMHFLKKKKKSLPRFVGSLHFCSGVFFFFDCGTMKKSFLRAGGGGRVEGSWVMGEGGRFSCRLQNFQGRSSFFMQTYFVVLSVCEVVVVLGASLRFEEVGPRSLTPPTGLRRPRGGRVSGRPQTQRLLDSFFLKK